MARKPVSDDEIRSILKAEIADATNVSSQVSTARAENMDYYQGRPFGNEVDGRSAVVSSAVADTVEWILPTLIRIFCSNEDVCSFEPENEKDVNGAQQATEYVNFIWNRDNRGFLNTYSWFKDALLQKNGTIKIWWDDTPKTKRERYSGLDDATFTKVVGDKNVEVAEHTERTEEVAPGQEIAVHDLVVTRTIPGGRVCVEPVPPEEFLISKEARSIHGARFVGHRRQRTISDLRESGFPKEVVDRLASAENFDSSAEALARNTVEDQTLAGTTAVQNQAMQLVWVTECYIKIDVDGDGIAEMRKVTAAGPGAEILSNDAWDTPRPFADLTPIIMPHRYHGLAVADVIKDIQLIKSTLFRQFLDNLYLQNNAREQVIESRIIDPSEVLSSAPGRKIRIKDGEGGAVIPIVVQDVGRFALEGLSYMDQVQENRTGVSARTQGLGANALHETAAGERMLMSAAMGRIELIARVFAETGVRDAFRLILKLICMYQDEPRTVRLTGKPFVAYDPSQWNSDMDMQVSVGLGIGDRDQQMMHAQLLGQAQAQAAQLGFVSPENFKNTAELLINGMGLKGVDRFFSFPQDPNAAKQPVKIPPKGAGHQVDPQLEMQKAQIQARSAAQVAQIKAQADTQVKNAQAQAKAASDSNLHQIETQQETLHNQQQMQLEAFKAKVDGALELAVAHIHAAAQIEAARITAKYSDGADAESRESAGEAA